MSKKIFLIESDTAFSRKLRAEFEGKGFTVAETADGKTAVDAARRESPDLIVLAVELSAGQSGYIVCGKLKKDDELKRIPVIITGKDADGFESHKRLKTRAEDYLRKPFEPPAILEKVGDLIGFPEEEQLTDVVLDEDESLGLGSLTDDEPMTIETPVLDETRDDPDLDLLDAAFETSTDDDESTTVVSTEAFSLDDDDEELTALEPVTEEPVEAPPEEGLVLSEEPFDSEVALEALGESEIDADAAFDALTDDEPLTGELIEEKPLEEEEVSLDPLDALDAIEEEPPVAAPARQYTPRPPRAPVAALAAIDTAELDSLREKVSELEDKIGELEDEVAAKTNELEAVKSTTGGKDREFFALKEQNTRKDKEILRLKQDLNEKEQEVLDLREKENGLELQLSQQNTELATRDAQIKTLSQKVESLNADKRKSDAAAMAARDEVRNMSATLATAQGELDQAQDAINEKAQEAAAARREAEAARTEADEARAQLESLREQLDEARREADAARGELDQARNDAEEARSELSSRSSQWEEESRTLRARIAELEEANGRNEDRVVKAYQKIKVEEKLKEKTRKALAVAMQLLDENAVSASAVVNSESEEEALS